MSFLEEFIANGCVFELQNDTNLPIWMLSFRAPDQIHREQCAFGFLAISQKTSCIIGWVHYRSGRLTPVIHLEYLHFTLKCQYVLRYSDGQILSMWHFQSSPVQNCWNFLYFYLRYWLSKMAIFNSLSIELYCEHHCHWNKRLGLHSWPAGF